VLAYDGANMTQIDAGGILDIAWLVLGYAPGTQMGERTTGERRQRHPGESSIIRAMAAVERIEGFRALGDHIIETIINKSEKVKELKNKAKEKELTEKQKKQLTRRRNTIKRKLVQEN